MRSLPDLATVLLEAEQVEPASGKIEAAAVEFMREDLPMIETVSRIDMTKGELQATRSLRKIKICGFKIIAIQIFETSLGLRYYGSGDVHGISACPLSSLGMYEGFGTRNSLTLLNVHKE